MSPLIFFVLPFPDKGQEENTEAKTRSVEETVENLDCGNEGHCQVHEPDAATKEELTQPGQCLAVLRVHPGCVAWLQPTLAVNLICCL